MNNGAGRERPVAYNPDAHASGRSDIGIVPVNPPNNAGHPVAEVGEGRPVAKGNAAQFTKSQTQRWQDLLHEVGRVRESAKGQPSDPRQEPYGVILRVRICAGGAGQPASLPRTVRPGKVAQSRGCEARPGKAAPAG